MFNLSISPPLTELILKPSAKFTQAYQIKNNSKRTIYLSTTIKQWQPQGNSGSVTYFDYNTNQVRFSLNNADLKLGQNFALLPNQEKQIILKLTNNPDTPDQDYYFTLFFNQIDPGGLNSTAVGQIGSHILISSSKNLSSNVTANIRNIKITPKLKDIFFTPISFQIDLENQSSNFFKAQGSLVIQKGGKVIKELPINPQNILASSSHLLSCLDNDKIVPCTIKPPFWPGPYTATLKLDSEISYTLTSHSFLVLPYSIIALIITISGLVFLFKKIKNKLK